MFTGLIRHVGHLASRVAKGKGARLCLHTPLALQARLIQGASICTNGVCLTVVGVQEGAFEADLSPETLHRTTLGALSIGAAVHLEPALCMGDPLDGHWVSGHVDGVGHLVSREDSQDLWHFAMPPALAGMIAPKGSVTVDGISLTVVSCTRERFSVALIPETVQSTRLQSLRVGEPVNLEGDPIGRFVARALALQTGDVRLNRFLEKGWED